MSDFQDALRRTLEGNAEVVTNRQRAEAEMDRIDRERARAEERRRAEALEQLRARHAELVTALDGILRQVAGAATQQVDARAGWSPSGEEYLAKLTTVGLSPKRSLFIELDRDDDEVLARWRSDVGDSIEIWRLHEVTEPMLAQLVLQLLDESVWSARSGPPPFPGVG